MGYLGQSDPQIFLNWLHNIDKCFTQYPFSESEKVRFAITELIGQASQYWTDLISMRASHGQEPIDTWSYMKDELKGKYVPLHYYKYFLDKWRKISQGNKTTKEYVNEFDEFLNHYNILGKHSDVQVFPNFVLDFE